MENPAKTITIEIDATRLAQLVVTAERNSRSLEEEIQARVDAAFESLDATSLINAAFSVKPIGKIS